MKQFDIFRERINYYRETLHSDPQYLTLNTWEFSRLKEECESFGTVAMSYEELKKEHDERKYSDQVGTLFGVPVRVSKVESK